MDTLEEWFQEDNKQDSKFPGELKSTGIIGEKNAIRI